MTLTDFQRLRLMAQALLAAEAGLPTRSRIRQLLAQIRPSCPDVTDEQVDTLALLFEENFGIVIEPPIALDLPYTPWLEAQRSRIEPYYWDRYRELLVDKGWPAQVIAEVDNGTDRIVGYLENPTKLGTWDRRGMVIGDVQSGKTANYLGVVTKAADAGYRVIVIIAGLQNKLRDQTQRRVDEGFIGFDTAAGISGAGRTLIGVGRRSALRVPFALTTALRDFNKDVAESNLFRLQDLPEPAVLVIKKNPSTLRNLIAWLTTHNATLGPLPMLLVDDEADNASINIKHRLNEISTINGLVRELLRLFERSCYVGYTATPFANIFIDPDDDDEMVGHDLFPRDFIVCLNSPSNYFGANHVFRDHATTVVRDVDDHRDLLPMSHTKDHSVTAVPNSLLEAIRVFLVARAIKLGRGQAATHSSMLVNVSRFVAVQRQVRNEIHSVVSRISRSVRVNGARPFDQAVRDPEIAALYQVFCHHYEDTCEHQWPDVQGRLHESVSAVKIVEINNKSADSLDYAAHQESGLNVIAVGGMSLSRGLTLEGLTVSYFLRRSIMYDTLFQMGRWFGYRDGYADLCRVWMPEQAQGWYEHIAESIEELRDELIQMQSGNATPREFGLKVRGHPDALLVTARNKMGSSARHRVLIGLANRFVETAVLYRDNDTLQANLRAVENLAESMRVGGLGPERGEQLNGSRLVRGVPLALIDRFLSRFKNHPASPATASSPVRRYIMGRHDELGEWDVLFAGVRRESPKSLACRVLGFRLVCQRRKRGDAQDDSMLMITSKRRVASRGIEKVGLTQSQIDDAEKGYRRAKPKAKNYPDRIYRDKRTKPLLIVHLLAIGKEEEDLSKKTPIAAWSISFPKTDRQERRVEYVVTKRWFREHSDDMDDDHGQ